MKMLKRTLALMLALIMMFSAVPFNAYATESTDQPSTPTEAPVDAPEAPSEDEVVPEDEEVPEVDDEPIVTYTTRASSSNVEYKYNVVHLDAGRKYFSVDNIKAIIDNIYAAGFNQLNLYLSDNQGFRFALDDMTLTTDYGTYDLTPALGDGYSSSDNKAPDGTGMYLTQSEMDEIITYAHSKGIDIVPAINVPGHMGAILEEFTSFRYSSSKSSIDLDNDEAVAFALALTEKYAAYFASKGCKYYCVGADEYANDLSSMGFEGMGADLYTKFVQFLNDAADIVIAKGMTPRAFNDGFYYKDYSISTEPNKAYEVYYWSSGWNGYDVAAATTIAAKGHKMINTHGSYYWILGGTKCTASTAAQFNTTYFQGSTVSNPAGSMFCIWCDVGNADSSENVISDTAPVIAAFGDALPEVEALVSGVVTPDPEPEVPVEPEKPETVTKTDEATKVEITAPGLTDLTVTVVDEVPTIEGAAEGKVLAWDMTPATAEGKYEGEATVAVPVPEGWDSSKMGAFVIEADNSVKLIDGAVNADGNFEFTMPHFSVGGTYEVAPIAAPPENITLEIGGTQEYTLDGLVGTEGTYTTTNGVASYTIVHHTETTPAGTNVSEVSTVAAGTYILGNGTNSWITLNNGNVGTTSDPANATDFTIAKSGSNWTIKSDNYYLTIDGHILGGHTLGTTADSVTWSHDESGFYQTKNFISDYNAYLNANAGIDTRSTNNPAKLYTRTTGTGSTTNTTTITFTALAGGTDSVEIGSTTYNITVNRKTVTDTVTVNANKTYADNSTAIVSNTDASVATATLNNGTLTINGLKAGSTVITTNNAVYNITVVTEDLTKVDPLYLETWITNRALQTSGTTAASGTNSDDNPYTYYTKKITADTSDVATESGVTIASLVDKNYSDSNGAYVYWRARYLTETVQDNSAGNNQTAAGDSVVRIRYWNTKWQYQNDAGAWKDAGDVNGSSLPQIIAYYLQVTTVTDEVTTKVVDHGVVPFTNFTDTRYCIIDYAVKMESGRRTPSAYPVEGKTQSFHCDNSDTNTVHRYSNTYYREIGLIFADETSTHEVYMITVTPTSSSIGNTTTAITSYTYDTFEPENGDTDPVENSLERVIWVDDEANLGYFTSEEARYSGYSDTIAYSVGGEPIVPGVEILRHNGVLITYYVRAKKTEDALTVHFLDKKENLEFASYNIAVAEGTLFDEGIALNTANPNGDLLKGTVTNYYNKPETVSADLSTVSSVGAQYLYTEYECVEVVRSDDGKDVYLYYEFDPTVSFVVDFGLPMTITGADLSDKLEGVAIVDMYFSGVALTQYGKLTDNGNTVTYEPTKIMRGNDYFTLVVKTTTAVDGILDSAATTIAFRVYVAPATTVYYEEGFLLNNASGWETTTATINNQSTVVLGETGTNNYGYDDAYATKGTDTGYITGGAGASTSFTFTGTGFQLYGNSNSASGVVTVYSLGNLNKLYMIDTKLSAGTSGATNQQSSGTYYSLPFISETDLPYGTYTVQIKQTNNQGSIYLDGVRVFNTINEENKTAEDSIYRADLEDKPDFYEVRDFVLNAIDVEKLEDSQYTDPADRVGLVDKVSDMAGQVYNTIAANSASAVIVDKSESFTATDVKDLLDNGPKNELYLYKDQTLVFNVKTPRVVQLGLKAPTGSASFNLTVNGTKQDLSSLSTSVDMFYDIAAKGAATNGYTVTITNTGSNVLSVTLLKICDDPNFTFNALTQEDIENTLLGIYGLTDVDTPVEPEAPEETTKPTEPEVEETKPTKPNKPSKPEKPGKPENTKPTEPEVEETTKPSKPSKPGKPENTKPTEPQKPGKPGNNSNQKPAKPGKNDKDEEKTYTLKITFVNLFGKKVGTATITTTNGMVSASQIAGKAPARYKALWFIPVTLRANGNTSIVVPVI